MAKLLLELSDTEESVSRPVIMSVVRQILKTTGLPIDTKIFFPKENENDSQIGSRINEDTTDVKFETAEKIFINVEEGYVQDRLLSTAIYRPDEAFIFTDNSLDVYVKPGYSSTDIRISFKYRSRNKTTAKKWRDDIRARVSMSKDINIHNVEFQYLIPNEVVDTLKHLHDLREGIAGYGDTFADYISKHLSVRASVVTNLNGEQNAWAIKEGQLRIEGWYNFEGVPDKEEKENDSGNYSISFTYQFRFDKPILMVVNYPIMIHNQLVKYELLPQVPKDIDDVPAGRNATMKYYQGFENHRVIESLSRMAGQAIPDIDDFIPEVIIPKTLRVFTALTNITVTDKKSLLSLLDLGSIKFKDILIDFLKGEAQYMARPYYSIFNVSLYKNVKLQSYSKITIDNNLNISAIDDLDLREYHHVRFSLVTDLSLLTKDAMERLRKSGIVAQLILNAIDPSLNGRPNILLNDIIGKKELEDVMYMINRNTKALDGTLARTLKTVESFYVQVNN